MTIGPAAFGSRFRESCAKREKSPVTSDPKHVPPAFEHVSAQNHRVRIHILCFGAVFSGGAVAVQSSAPVRSFVAYGLNRALFERRAGSSGAVAGVPPHLSAMLAYLIGVSVRR